MQGREKVGLLLKREHWVIKCCEPTYFTSRNILLD